MKVSKRKSKMKITKRKVRKAPAKELYTVQDAFFEVLMTLPDQPARHVALDAALGSGPGATDIRASARTALRAAERLRWEHWQARAKLEEVVA